MTDFNWKKYIKEALDRTEFMALATVGNDGGSVCPVQFSYDEKNNLYFKSMPNSRHMRHIKEHPEVSVATFSTEWLPEPRAYKRSLVSVGKSAEGVHSGRRYIFASSLSMYKKVCATVLKRYTILYYK